MAHQLTYHRNRHPRAPQSRSKQQCRRLRSLPASLRDAPHPAQGGQKTLALSSMQLHPHIGCAREVQVADGPALVLAMINPSPNLHVVHQCQRKCHMIPAVLRDQTMRGLRRKTCCDEHKRLSHPSHIITKPHNSNDLQRS